MIQQQQDKVADFAAMGSGIHRSKGAAVDQDCASTASSGSGTGRLHIIEGLRRQDSRITKYKKLHSDLSKKFISLYEQLQTCQQQQRLDEELLKARSTQHALLDVAITEAIRHLGQGTSRNALATVKHVLNTLSTAKAASSQMQGISTSESTTTAPTSAVVTSALFTKSGGVASARRSSLLEQASEMNSAQSSIQLRVQSSPSVIPNRSVVGTALTHKRPLDEGDATSSPKKKATATSSMSGMLATMRPPQSPQLHSSDVDSRHRHSGKITLKKKS